MRSRRPWRPVASPPTWPPDGARALARTEGHLAYGSPVLRGAVDDLPIWLLLFIVVAAIVGLLYPFSGDRAIAPEPFRSRGLAQFFGPS